MGHGGCGNGGDSATPEAVLPPRSEWLEEILVCSNLVERAELVRRDGDSTAYQEVRSEKYAFATYLISLATALEMGISKSDENLLNSAAAYHCAEEASICANRTEGFLDATYYVLRAINNTLRNNTLISNSELALLKHIRQRSQSLIEEVFPKPPRDGLMGNEF